MKKLLFLFALMFLMFSFISGKAKADDGNILYLYSKSSTTPTKFSLDELDKITFSDDGMLMWNRNGTGQIPFEDFLLFTFSEIEHPYLSSVESTSIQNDLKVRLLEGRMLLVDSSKPLSGVSVYDLQGRVVANESSASTTYRISLSTAPTGIFLIKTIVDGKVIVKKIIL